GRSPAARPHRAAGADMSGISSVVPVRDGRDPATMPGTVGSLCSPGGSHRMESNTASVEPFFPGVADPKSVLGKTALILDAFAADSPTLTFSDLCERTGLPRSTVHRVLEQLVDYRWLER